METGQKLRDVGLFSHGIVYSRSCGPNGPCGFVPAPGIHSISSAPPESPTILGLPCTGVPWVCGDGQIGPRIILSSALGLLAIVLVGRESHAAERGRQAARCRDELADEAA